jgi:small acid-soluble spore protein (thioredoxin-like protein)
MKNKPNPDDRSDNVENIQFNIDNTIKNIRLGEEMIAKTDDEDLIRVLKAKNERRRDSLEGMREEIRDEALYQREKHNQ